VYGEQKIGRCIGVLLMNLLVLQKLHQLDEGWSVLSVTT
jgi:hypothetical protein